MASNAFREVAARHRETKSLDTPIGNSKFLEAGEHQVVVQTVDTAKISEDTVELTFANGQNQTIRKRIFLLNKSKDSFSYGLRQFLSAVVAPELIADVLDLLKTDDQHGFEIFTGLKLGVEVKRKPGFDVRSVGGQAYAAFAIDNEGNDTGTQITGEYEDIQSARTEAEAQGLRRSFPEVTEFKALEVQENAPALSAAIAARRRLLEA